MDCPPPDRERGPGAAIHAARCPGDLRSRAGGTSHAGGSQPGHRRSRAPGPVRPLCEDPAALDAGGQCSRLSDRCPRSAPQGQGRGRPGGVGRSQQAAPAAFRQAIRVAEHQSRHRRQQHRPPDAVRRARVRGGRKRQPDRRLQGASRRHKPEHRPRALPADGDARLYRRRGCGAATARGGTVHRKSLRLPDQQFPDGFAAVRARQQVQRKLHQLRRQRTGHHAAGDRRRERPCRDDRQHHLLRHAPGGLRQDRRGRAKVTARSHLRRADARRGPVSGRRFSRHAFSHRQLRRRRCRPGAVGPGRSHRSAGRRGGYSDWTDRHRDEQGDHRLFAVVRRLRGDHHGELPRRRRCPD